MKKVQVSVQILLFACAACCVSAQRRPPRPTTAPPSPTPPRNNVCSTVCPTSGPFTLPTIDEDDDYILVETNTCPPYDNPGWSNRADACLVDKTIKIPLYPTYANTPIPVGEALSEYKGITYLKTDPAPIFGGIGVLVNGVQVFGVGSPCGFNSDCSDEGAPTDYVDAVDSEGHTVDHCGGHAAPTGNYHVHSAIGISTSAEREACELPADVEGEHSQRLGWMYDGFGIYGRYSQGGQLPTNLDDCGGHTHEIDGVMVYHYHFPDEFPWTIGCFKGCPEVSNNQRELGSINSNADYGCPEGLSEDPDPHIEPAQAIFNGLWWY